MRRWLALFLLAFIPLQFTWAAVSPYCEHERGAQAEHFGHHGHDHEAAANGSNSPDPAKTGGVDPDCGPCHSGGMTAVTCSFRLPEVAASPCTERVTHSQPTSLHVSRPERPNWTRLA
jgi:hypothetical protein